VLPRVPVAIDDARMQEANRWLKSRGFSWAEIAPRIDLVGNVWFKTEWFLDRMDRVAARIKDTPPVDDLDVLIRLFVLQLPVTSKRFDETIPAELASSFEAMGLVTRHEGRVEAPVAVLEHDGIFIVSDTFKEMADDLALLPLGDQFPFVSTITRRPGERYLDLCTGSGIYALLRSRTNRDVIGVDINARPLGFAEFNRRLNGIDNVRFMKGDLYKAVSGKFDIISANPPFFPDREHPTEKRGDFGHGGAAGDLITNEILEGLDNHLVDGGYCFVLSFSLYWKDGSVNPNWPRMQAKGYDILQMSNAVPLDDPTVAPQGLRDALRVGAERIEFGPCVFRKHAGEKRAGWLARAPFVEKLGFDVHDLFGALSTAATDDARDEITRSYFKRHA